MRDETTPAQRLARHMAAMRVLSPRGFEECDWMLFEKDGRVYDLSAADLEQIERIERERLCVVSYTTRAARDADKLLPRPAHPLL